MSQQDYILKQIKEIREFMEGKSFENELLMALNNKIQKLYTELLVLERPDLKDKTCGVCLKKYDGWGNNPYPVICEPCCDNCNTKFIMPMRIRCITREEFEKVKKSQKKRK
jgi:hypothetical protein